MLQKKENIMGFCFLIPALILISILIIYPLINTIYLSFRSQLIYELKGHFIGLANYIEILQDQDKEFWNALSLSIIWTVVTVIAQVLLGVGAALLLNEDFIGRTLARALVLLPFFMPTISITLMWKWLLNENYGIFNNILIQLNIISEPISWLGNSHFAFFSVICIAIWRFSPFVIISILACLQTIPLELYEAAEIDGANKWVQFRNITLPAIKGVLLVVILLRGIFMFKKVDLFLILTGGGPGTATQTLPVLIYKSAFHAMQLGKGAAYAIVVLLVSIIFITLYMRITGKSQEEVG